MSKIIHPLGGGPSKFGGLGHPGGGTAAIRKEKEAARVGCGALPTSPALADFPAKRGAPASPVPRCGKGGSPRCKTRAWRWGKDGLGKALWGKVGRGEELGVLGETKGKKAKELLFSMLFLPLPPGRVPFLPPLKLYLFSPLVSARFLPIAVFGGGKRKWGFQKRIVWGLIPLRKKFRFRRETKFCPLRPFKWRS